MTQNKPDYRGWNIDADPNGYGFHGTHEDYDGPEDRRHVHGWTEEQARREIDAHLEEYPEDGNADAPTPSPSPQDSSHG
jgi:hypothetical protein